MSTLGRTAGPWNVGPSLATFGKTSSMIIGADGHAIANVGTASASDRANAAFIVKACNAHDELVAALQGMVDYAESPDFDGAPSDACLAKACAALAKVQPTK